MSQFRRATQAALEKSQIEKHAPLSRSAIRDLWSSDNHAAEPQQKRSASAEPMRRRGLPDNNARDEEPSRPAPNKNHSPFKPKANERQNVLRIEPQTEFVEILRSVNLSETDEHDQRVECVARNTRETLAVERHHRIAEEQFRNARKHLDSVSVVLAQIGGAYLHPDAKSKLAELMTLLHPMGGINTPVQEVLYSSGDSSDEFEVIEEVEDVPSEPQVDHRYIDCESEQLRGMDYANTMINMSLVHDANNMPVNYSTPDILGCCCAQNSDDSACCSKGAEIVTKLLSHKFNGLLRDIVRSRGSRNTFKTKKNVINVRQIDLLIKGEVGNVTSALEMWTPDGPKFYKVTDYLNDNQSKANFLADAALYVRMWSNLTK